MKTHKVISSVGYMRGISRTWLVAAAVAALASSALSTDLYWCGGGTSSKQSTWNATNPYWKVDDTGDSVSWSSATEPRTAYFTSSCYFNMQGVWPYSMVVDSADTVRLHLGAQSSWGNQLANLTNFVKRGSCEFSFYDEGNMRHQGSGLMDKTCFFDVQQGTLAVDLSSQWTTDPKGYNSTNNVRRFLGNSFIRVASGATYKATTLLGLGEKDANQPSIELNGGTWISTGSSDHVDHVKNLYYNGGTIKIWSGAVPTIMGKLSVTGTTARTISISADKYLQFNPGPGQTEIYVDDVTGDSTADFTWPVQSSESRIVSTNGFVKTGNGTLQIDKNWKGDITGVCEVREGKIRLYENQAYMDCNEYTFLVNTNGTLEIPLRNNISPQYTIYHGRYAKTRHLVYGGHLILGDTNVWGACYLGEELLLDNARWTCRFTGVSSSDSGLGALTLARKVTLRGETPYVFSPNSWNHESSAAYHLYPESEGGTILTVDDITGNALVDATFNVRLRDYYSSSNRNSAASSPDCLLAAGLTKKGPGTAYLANPKNSFKGPIRVDEGALWTDGPAASAAVAAGAFLGGTGTVASVTLSEGAGFSVPVGQTQPLRVTSAVTLPASGVIDIVCDGAAPARVNVPVLTSAAGVTGDLSGWTVRVNGTADRHFAAQFRQGTLYARRLVGLTVIFK